MHCVLESNPYRIVWACQPRPAYTPNTSPVREQWEGKLRDPDHARQASLVPRARGAAHLDGVLD